MKVLYFAWLKQKVGLAEEEVSPPSEVTDVAGLLDWLSKRSPRHGDALARRGVVRVAVNQSYAKLDHPVRGDDEIALFPPVTGG
jgi:sulfur-carrier protein